MGTILKIVAIATVRAWLAIHANPAAAQNFNDRWSVIPKAHAGPAPEPPAQTKQDEQRAQPSSRTGRPIIRKITLPPGTLKELSPEGLRSIRTGELKQRAVARSTVTG
jgi:hypothetical protein